jgi:hypothetical protein
VVEYWVLNASLRSLVSAPSQQGLFFDGLNVLNGLNDLNRSVEETSF